MKYYFVLIFFWLCPFRGQGQELIWEKKIPLSSYESFSCVIKAESGDYFALGTSDRWRIFNPSSGGGVIMKFDENGDTLWTKFTGYYGSFIKVLKGENGSYYALLYYSDQSLNVWKYGIYSFNDDGIFLGLIPIYANSNMGLMDMKFEYGHIWICGDKIPSLFYPGATTFDFLLMKLRFDGTEVFSFAYNANNPTCRGQKMEFMPNGNILFGGSVGNRIGAFEIDTAGSQIQYRTYFTNNFNGGWQNQFVKQFPGDNRIVGGNRSTSPASHYLGKHDSTGLRIWGGISRGGAVEPMVFTDSTIIQLVNRANPDFCEIRRLSSDSSILWSLDLLSSNFISGRRAFYDVWHNPDSSGVCVGTVAEGSIQNLYIGKFAKLGIIYNSTSPKAFENLKTDAVPIAFPNPGKDVVRFTILAGPGKVSFTDMQGRKVFEGEYVPEKGVSTKGFAAGIYNYWLERNGKVWGGKWVKAP